MSYAIFAITQSIGLVLVFAGASHGGETGEKAIGVGGKTMLGGAILACCIKYLFS